MQMELFTRDWYNNTLLHPLGLAALIMLCAAVMFVRRRWVVPVMLMLVCFIPSAQRISPATLDFHFLRIIVLVGWARVLMRGELAGFRFKRVDGFVVLWAVCSSIVHAVGQGTLAAVVNRLGFLYDALGMYFLFRMIVRDWSDVTTIARAAACISIPVAAAFLLEKSTGRNVFSIFGGVPEFTTIRQEKLRCQGAFSHPILAGCFWAALCPLILSLWPRGKFDRTLAYVGALCCGIVIITCTSSTPIIASMVMVGGCALFFGRALMPWIRVAAVPALIALQLAMIAPIWHLISRMSLVPGSTSYYRFKLFDEFIQHFGEWWLAGTDNVLHWWGYANGDITNHYVMQGVTSGLLGLLLFIAMILIAFWSVGLIRTRSERIGRLRFASWALGVTLVVHCVAFMAVSYFGQIDMIWFLALAMVGSLTPATTALVVRVRPAAQPATVPTPTPAPTLSPA